MDRQHICATASASTSSAPHEPEYHLMRHMRNETHADNAVLPAVRHYYPGICHTCLRMPPDPVHEPLQPGLMRCSGCQLVVYCSKRCQKMDWRHHRDLCRANKVEGGKNVFENAKNQVAHGGSWFRYRNRMYSSAMASLKRKLEPYEYDIFMFPRVCNICLSAKQDQLADCPMCHSVFYCSSEHRDVDRPQHQTYCLLFLFMHQCDKFEAAKGMRDIPLPVEVDAVYKNLPDGLMTLLNPEKEREPLKSLGVEGMKFFMIIGERLSYPLSLQYVLENVGLGSDNKPLHDMTKLSVFVVGAKSDTEVLGIHRWEYLAHRLPALQVLRVVFIGPELFLHESSDEDSSSNDYILEDSGEAMCDDCKAKPRRIVYELANMYYHDFVVSSYYSKPDVVIAYNCGFGEHVDSKSEDTWQSSFPLLVADPAVPLVFTSHTLKEAHRDLSALQAAAPVKVVMPTQRNPFSSCRPHRDDKTESPASNPFFFLNQYITCVRRADE
ncbi:uncharacterized protein LOC108677787 [Hyalella azteca]|uniref:Uncharacterized protein LOC108677787 n=1 Tax=Hyalella azteca TaxID=294128 RepID=A0A8B7P6H6_HYAAZ|nr:uncharacterized protein LOC108677787 [Hyalella azteca]